MSLPHATSLGHSVGGVTAAVAETHLQQWFLEHVRNLVLILLAELPLWTLQKFSKSPPGWLDSVLDCHTKYKPRFWT